MMNRLKITTAALLMLLPLLTSSCASYNAYQKAQGAERMNDWDTAVQEYEKALQVDPQNMRFKIGLQRAKLEASRAHFAKGKKLRTASEGSNNSQEQIRLAQLAAQELELTVRLDPTNQFAIDEYTKATRVLQDYNHAADHNSIAEMKKRANTKAQPPALNPTSNDPLSLSFPRETPVKDIYRALGNAFGINILFDQAVKDDRISIELKDVTAQQALERVMQAANHFYKVLDEHTIIVVPDNPQARRDYEDLVIRTFYLSNGDAEQVTNVVRTMIEARNVFPLKALNAITIRDTADKVRIAEKIIEANDKAKAEVVVDVELLQMDLDKSRELGAFVSGTSGSFGPQVADDKGVLSSRVGTINDFRNLTSGSYTFTFPTVNYSLLKSVGNTQTLANPELRISEGEKATLHIGQRVPVPVSTIPTINTGGTGGNLYGQVTSYQYQDVGIKVAIEPRVHHNREVTLKLTVEVSDLGATKTIGGQDLPSFITRTIEATIRLKDGETNFLAGLIQQTDQDSDAKTPFLGDIPILGRLFTKNVHGTRRTDLMLTMTPHIIRIPDITDEDLAPMWVGTQNNLTFRGVSPRIESQAGIDPFTLPRPSGQFSGRDPNAGLQLSSDGEPGNYVRPDAPLVRPGISVPQGSGPNNVFQPPQQPTPNQPPVPEPQSRLNSSSLSTPSGGASSLNASAASTAFSDSTTAAATTAPTEFALRLSPRISPQPTSLPIRSGEEKLWTVVGMDLDGLSANELIFHYDPSKLDVSEVVLGPAMKIDTKYPPAATVNRDLGTIRVVSTDGKPLTFNSGGDLLALRVHGGLSGEAYLVMENPDLRDGKGAAVMSAVSGGRVKVQ